MIKSALFAGVAMLALMPVAHAGDIGGGIGVFNLHSGAIGGSGTGNVGATGLIGPGSINTSFTQVAHTDVLAGSIAKLEKLPNGFTTSVVSELQSNNYTGQGMVGGIVGNGFQANLGGGIALGGGVTTGDFTGISAYANW